MLLVKPGQTLVGKSDIARAVGRTVRTVERWIARGKLPPGLRIGGRLAWPADELAKHLEGLRVAARA